MTMQEQCLLSTDLAANTAQRDETCTTCTSGALYWHYPRLHGSTGDAPMWRQPGGLDAIGTALAPDAHHSIRQVPRQVEYLQLGDVSALSHVPGTQAKIQAREPAFSIYRPPLQKPRAGTCAVINKNKTRVWAGLLGLCVLPPPGLHPFCSPGTPRP